MIALKEGLKRERSRRSLQRQSPTGLPVGEYGESTMQKCVVCLSHRAYPICKTCSKNQFKIEKCRQILAESSDLFSLRKLYRKSLPEIKNVNTEEFWNAKFISIQNFNNQDPITKDRIRTAASLIPRNAKKILDVAAGYGFLEEHIFHHRKDISSGLYGFDISSNSVRLLNKRFGDRFKRGSVYKPPFGKGSFDVVLALEILEHIPPSKVFAVLGVLKQLLIKRGILILSVPLNENLELRGDNPSGHLREYTSSLILAELKLEDIVVDDYKEFYAFNKFYQLKNIFRHVIPWKIWKSNNIVIKSTVL